MRIPIFLLLALIFANTSKAQINKGQFLVGGSISIESVNNEGDGVRVVNYKTTSFSLSPKVGYFLITKLAAGLRLDFSIFHQKLPNTNTQTNISPSPFFRYYLLSPTQKVNCLVDVSYVASIVRNRFQGSPVYTEKSNGYFIAAGPSIFLNHFIALEFLLGYREMRIKDVGENKNATFNTQLGLQVHLDKLKSNRKAKEG